MGASFVGIAFTVVVPRLLESVGLKYTLLSFAGLIGLLFPLVLTWKPVFNKRHFRLMKEAEMMRDKRQMDVEEEEAMTMRMRMRSYKGKSLVITPSTTKNKKVDEDREIVISGRMKMIDDNDNDDDCDCNCSYNEDIDFKSNSLPMTSDDVDDKGDNNSIIALNKNRTIVTNDLYDSRMLVVDYRGDDYVVETLDTNEKTHHSYKELILDKNNSRTFEKHIGDNNDEDDNRPMFDSAEESKFNFMEFKISNNNYDDDSVEEKSNNVNMMTMPQETDNINKISKSCTSDENCIGLVEKDNADILSTNQRSRKERESRASRSRSITCNNESVCITWLTKHFMTMTILRNRKFVVWSLASVLTCLGGYVPLVHCVS